MNNIQKFLEEKSKATASYLNCSQEDVYVQYLMVVDFVLSEVEREVEKKLKWADDFDCEVIESFDILKIINNLK